MKTAVLTLVNSKNPPAFETPMLIAYGEKPKTEQSFLFSCSEFPYCNTSEVKAIVWDTERSICWLETRNSVYQVQEVFPVEKDNFLSLRAKEAK